MGWSYGHNVEGEEVGYSVPAVCNEPGCEAKIDRGLSYTCGGLDGHSGVIGTCGKPFCSEHLLYGSKLSHDAVCSRCYEATDQDYLDDCCGGTEPKESCCFYMAQEG